MCCVQADAVVYVHACVLHISEADLLLLMTSLQAQAHSYMYVYSLSSFVYPPP